MNTCVLCHEPTRNRRLTVNGWLLCTTCRDYFEWFDSLPIDQQRWELAAGLRHEGEGV